MYVLILILLCSWSCSGFVPKPPSARSQRRRRSRAGGTRKHQQPTTTLVLSGWWKQGDDNSANGVSKTVTENLQRVAIVGSGAVGCFYGARLWEAGHDVRFFMRGIHYETCFAEGLNVTSIDGDILIPASHINLHQSTATMGPVDWVLVALKSTSLESIPELIEPLLSQETRVLVVMNGLIEEDLIRMLKKHVGESDDVHAPLQCCKALYGGMAFLCSNRLHPGQIDHSYAGLLTGGVASSLSEDAEEDQRAFDDLWRSTKVPTTYETSLLRGRWKKMIWNLPFNGISVAMGGITVDKIVECPSLRQLVLDIMAETVSIANADLKEEHGEGGFEPLGETEQDAMMKLSDSMGPYKTSTMLDLTNRRAMEVRYLFQVPVERSRRLGVEAKHLKTIVAQIEAFQRMYNLY